MSSERDEPEVVDGLPVLASDDDPATTAATPGGGLAPVPGRQVAALGAAGFVAGAATVALAHRRRTRTAARRLRKKKGRVAALGEVVSSGSFLVDVHVLRRD